MFWLALSLLYLLAMFSIFLKAFVFQLGIMLVNQKIHAEMVEFLLFA